MDEIKNFILIFYNNKIIDPPKWFTEDLKKTMLNYNHKKSFIESFKIMIRQIKTFYPNSKIHVMTNLKELPCNSRNVFIYNEDIPPDSNHIIKFKIYGLLEEPAMYLDLDILLNKKFEQTQLETNNDFNLYKSYKAEKLCKIYEGVDEAYNAGIVWIKNPNKKISSDLFEIYAKYLSNQIYLDSIEIRRGNDEHSLAVYIKKNNLKMNIIEEVNKPRMLINNMSEIKNYQSVHYTGMEAKPKFRAEYWKLYGKIL